MGLLFTRWPAATNLVTNGGFETNTTGWSAVATASISQVTSSSKFGSASMLVEGSAANDGASFAGTGNAGQNDPYTLSCWMRSPTGTDDVVQVYVSSVGGSFEFLAIDSLTLSSEWQRVVISGTWAEASHTGWTFVARCSGLGFDFEIDGVQYESGPIATPYIETDGGTVTRSAGSVIASVGGGFITPRAQYS